MMQEVKAAVEENPSISVLKLSRKHSLAEAITRRLMRGDLGLKSSAKQKDQMVMSDSRKMTSGVGDEFLISSKHSLIERSCP